MSQPTEQGIDVRYIAVYDLFQDTSMFYMYFCFFFLIEFHVNINTTSSQYRQGQQENSCSTTRRRLITKQ
jgi:hypothetical protein